MDWKFNGKNVTVYIMNPLLKDNEKEKKILKNRDKKKAGSSKGPILKNQKCFEKTFELKTQTITSNKFLKELCSRNL
jgi:hypothetical protein